MFEQIMSVVVAAAPAIAAIAGVIISVLKHKESNKVVVDKFEELRTEVANTKEFEQLKLELKLAHEENVKLKKQLNEFLMKLDKIYREEE